MAAPLPLVRRKAKVMTAPPPTLPRRLLNDPKDCDDSREALKLLPQTLQKYYDFLLLKKELYFYRYSSLPFSLLNPNTTSCTTLIDGAKFILLFCTLSFASILSSYPLLVTPELSIACHFCSIKLPLSQFYKLSAHPHLSMIILFVSAVTSNHHHPNNHRHLLFYWKIQNFDLFSLLFYTPSFYFYTSFYFVLLLTILTTILPSTSVLHTYYTLVHSTSFSTLPFYNTFTQLIHFLPLSIFF